MSTDLVTLLGALVVGPSARCLGVIGAGEVDRWGNVNSSKVSEVRRRCLDPMGDYRGR